MDCKTGTEGKLKTITSKQELKKGQTIRPEHTCAIQITTKGMTIAKRPALKQKHRLKQIFPEHDRDNVTAKFMEIEYANITKEMINNLKKEIENEDTDNTILHISYNAITGILAAILITLLVLNRKKQKRNQNHNKQHNCDKHRGAKQNSHEKK